MCNNSKNIINSVYKISYKSINYKFDQIYQMEIKKLINWLLLV